jgi:hypothetical protein
MRAHGPAATMEGVHLPADPLHGLTIPNLSILQLLFIPPERPSPGRRKAARRPLSLILII